MVDCVPLPQFSDAPLQPNSGNTSMSVWMLVCALFVVAWQVPMGARFEVGATNEYHATASAVVTPQEGCAFGS